VNARQWYEAEIAYQDDLATVDLRGLAAWRLDILRDEAGTAGDEDMVETIDRIRRVRSGAVEITEQGVHEIVDDNEIVPGRATCGACGRSWDDSVSTGWTPAPGARCPFEYDHDPSDR
jgi:hypothetical protein